MKGGYIDDSPTFGMWRGRPRSIGPAALTRRGGAPDRDPLDGLWRSRSSSSRRPLSQRDLSVRNQSLLANDGPWMPSILAWARSHSLRL